MRERVRNADEEMAEKLGTKAGIFSQSKRLILGKK